MNRQKVLPEQQAGLSINQPCHHAISIFPLLEIQHDVVLAIRRQGCSQVEPFSFGQRLAQRRVDEKTSQGTGTFRLRAKQLFACGSQSN